MRVTEGVRKIIVEWHGKGVPPEETARSLRIPIDEVKAIILQAHPAPAQPKRPEFLAILKRASNRWRRYAPVSDERLVGRLESYVGLGRKFLDLLLDLTNEGAPWSYSRAKAKLKSPSASKAA